MSINFAYRRLSQSELDDLLSGSEKIYEKWFGSTDFENDEAFAIHQQRLEKSGDYLDISNSWQAIHFLLTDEFCFQGESHFAPPLKNVVMGGTPTDIETTYGVAFYLIPQEVADVARGLEPLFPEAVVRNYSAAKFRAAKVYPAFTHWDDNGVEDYGIYTDYKNLRQFFLDAAANNQAMLLSSE